MANILLTPQQVAERLNVSPRTVRAWIASGRIASVRLSERVVRVSEETLEALVSAGYVPRADALPMAAESGGAYTAAPATVTQTPTERLRALIDAHRDEMFALAKTRRAGNLRLFGSVVTGEAHDDSDIDILVDLEQGASLFDLGGLEYELEEMLGVKVDVVPAKSLKERIRDRVLAEAVPL